MAESTYVPDPRGQPRQTASLNLGGGSGVGQVYIDRAPAAPDDTTEAALSYPSGGGAIQEWDVATQTWL